MKDRRKKYRFHTGYWKRRVEEYTADRLRRQAEYWNKITMAQLAASRVLAPVEEPAPPSIN